MKRTPLARKSPLKAKKPMKRKAKRKQSARQKETRWRSPEYLAWVRTLTCCVCGVSPCDAHHAIGLGWGLSGIGLTAPDSYAMPLCRTCHGEVHKSPELQQQQPEWLAQTLERAMHKFEGDALDNLKQAMLFIEAKGVL